MNAKNSNSFTFCLLPPASESRLTSTENIKDAIAACLLVRAELGLLLRSFICTAGFTVNKFIAVI
ncbi:hypothetical protein [Nostoc sp. DedQUE03]|uniref:hypothetical protein n=1 Tax=Nostoc sp. DedQUE03 TaxID=3075389 RepID=UPI002AD8E709|nr:hypothetical protein [Nostoc sp. DedQUE03]MDZ8046362.1 hypothetical protein [Nostoc sp. DedQUE02]